VTEARFTKIRACLDRRQPDLAVVTDNVHKPHNVSAILRTCDAVGVFSLHAAMNPDEKFRARSGIAMGSDKWVDLTLYEEAKTAIKQLQTRGFQVVAVHKSDRSINFREVDYCQPTAVLFGAELFGVSDSAAALADRHVYIPMQGMVESYNVSVAAAIVLLEAQRQRDLAGLYDQCRLDKKTYEDTLYRWYRPTEARFCDENKLSYPALDDRGQLVDPAAFSALRDQLMVNKLSQSEKKP
jgi:tRNA (guanosine-2'-O-)-methyltransferase